MGFFRSILALSVVLFHAGGILGYDILGGTISVQCFYIVSGFYMAFILNEKYIAEKKSLFLFYTNRMLRLMPVYYLFLIVKIVLSIICIKLSFCSLQTVTLKHFLVYFDAMTIYSKIHLIFTNIFVMGQDIGIFLGFDISTGALFFTPKWWTSKPIVFTDFHFIPQAWTLGLEITFYLIAPFIVRRPAKVIIFILSLSFLLRYYIYSLGYDYNPWTHCFFPLEIAMFLIGTLSYKLYSYLKNTDLLPVKLSIPIFIILISTTLCYPLLPASKNIPYFFADKNIVFYAMILMALPFLFHLSKKNKLDRFIGELSYPLYLCHLMIIPFFGSYATADKSILGFSLILIISFAASIFAVLFIIKPIDKYRQARTNMAPVSIDQSS